MTRPKTRGGGSRKSKPVISDELADAAEAALDDLLTQAIPQADQTRPAIAVPARGSHNDESTVDAGRPISMADVEILEETQQPRAESEIGHTSALRVAVHEEQAHLGSIQSAIGAAGHRVIAAASGGDGARRIIETLAERTVDVVIAALPGGESVIDAALAQEPRRPVVIASVDASPVAAVQRAVGVNADLVALRPHDVGSLTPILFAATRLTIERRVTSAARGAEQALRARLDELADPDPRGLLPFEMFQRVLELEIKRAKRFEYALSVALFSVDVVGGPPPPGIKGILRARAGNALIHTIRDIDVATQIDHERFLVLLPYTDLKGATGLARRVIAAVAAIDPVVAAGRSMTPKLVGAVAGATHGQPVSFAKLMKDATRALDDARREGADFAVQP